LCVCAMAVPRAVYMQAGVITEYARGAQ
jgi:hypothetical protein